MIALLSSALMQAAYPQTAGPEVSSPKVCVSVLRTGQVLVDEVATPRSLLPARLAQKIREDDELIGVHVDAEQPAARGEMIDIIYGGELAGEFIRVSRHLILPRVRFAQRPDCADIQRVSQ